MEELQEVAAQMREAVARDFGAAFRLCEYKGALQHRLRKEREALRAPLGCRRVERFGSGDVLCDLRGVRADVGVTRVADRGVCVVRLLHHGAEEAGEFGDGPGEDRRAEFDIAEQAIQRIRELAIGRGTEKPLSHLGKMCGCGDRQIFLAIEVMEEGALGQAGCRADVVHRGPRIALRADHLHRRIQEASPGIGLCGRRAHVIPFSTYQLVGIMSSTLLCD
jgi:hypothetical protein